MNQRNTICCCSTNRRILIHCSCIIYSVFLSLQLADWIILRMYVFKKQMYKKTREYRIHLKTIINGLLALNSNVPCTTIGRAYDRCQMGSRSFVQCAYQNMHNRHRDIRRDDDNNVQPAADANRKCP